MRDSTMFLEHNVELFIAKTYNLRINTEDHIDVGSCLGDELEIAHHYGFEYFFRFYTSQGGTVTCLVSSRDMLDKVPEEFRNKYWTACWNSAVNYETILWFTIWKGEYKPFNVQLYRKTGQHS